MMARNKDEYINALEAVLFASDDPIDISQMAEILEISLDDMEDIFEGLNKRYEHSGGLTLKRIGEGYILIVKPRFNDYVVKLKPIRSTKLSRAAMETLAIIAFQQPITKIEISDMRGVKSDGVVAMLLVKGLIKAVGRKDTIGKPILYGTTDSFIQYFGLESINDLPKPENLKL